MSYILIPLREKYTAKGQSGGKGGAYRGRTGPHCCNDGCPSGRKKSGKFVDTSRPKFGMKL